MFRSQQTDGVIVAAPVMGSDTVSGLHSLGIPLVVVSGSTSIPDIPQVLVDNVQGARLVAEHLFSLGHRRIAHLPALEGNDDGRVRQEAFWSAIAARGGERRPQYAVFGTELHAHPAREIERLLRLPEPPTAIFAWNDRIARVALEVAHRLGVAVPQKLSVVGFDDLPSGDDARVPLTTVYQPVRALGEAAAHQLIERIETGECTTPYTLLPVSLVVRGSTSPPS
jgi:LacI family transcriptional regulator